jgi:hypothetical protein
MQLSAVTSELICQRDEDVKEASKKKEKKSASPVQ